MLKAAVIGLGEMGQHHARVYAQMPDVRLVAVCDLDNHKLENVTRAWGSKPYTNYIEMVAVEEPDIVSVAVPTSTHFRVAKTTMQGGCHVLVEKPITATLEEARLLLKFAEISGRILAVGHIERCNPVVSAVKRHIDASDLGRIYRISTRRVGPSPVRIRDVGCTVDLLVHDLDVARYLLRSEPLTYHAELLKANHGDYDDAVTAIVRFEDGVIGCFESDWLSSAKQRTLTITGERGVLTANYITQTGTLQYAPGKQENIAVVHEEPLAAELRSFVAAVRDEGRPAATGEDGLRALGMALRILECAS